MDMNTLTSLLETIPIQEILILLAATCAALAVASWTARLRINVGPAPARALADYTGQGQADDPVEKLGGWLLRRFPSLRSAGNVETQRRWLGLAGGAPSLPLLLGQALLLGVGGGVLALLSGVPLAWSLVALGALFPFLRLRSGANRIRRSVERALPELTALMAAEMAAGHPPDKALERAAEWGGPLAALVGEAVAGRTCQGSTAPGPRRRPRRAPGNGRPLQPAQSLRAFAAQVDMAARKGAAGPELMESLARMLVLEYKERSLREAEKLDSRLAVPSVLFFFLPFLFLILTPLLMPVLDLL